MSQGIVMEEEEGGFLAIPVRLVEGGRILDGALDPGLLPILGVHPFGEIITKATVYFWSPRSPVSVSLPSPDLALREQPGRCPGRLNGVYSATWVDLGRLHDSRIRERRGR